MKLARLMVMSLMAGGSVVQAQALVPQVPAESASAVQQRYGKSLRESPRQRMVLAEAMAADANKPLADEFLAKNAKAPGVQVLANGVQYKILKTGSGKRPQQGSTVRCQMVGSLVDGTTFEKIQDKGGSFLVIKGLVPGLQSAVTAMPVGSKWQIVVPPALGYGTKGTHAVAPNAVLIYQIELLAIK